MEWFRWFEGTTGDAKFLVVARRSGQPMAFVLAVWAMLLERASASSPRGDIAGFDCEAADALLGMPDGAAEAIVEAMRGKGLVDAERVCRWAKRQPLRERAPEEAGSSTERSRRCRAVKKEPSGQERPGRERQNADGNAAQRRATAGNAPEEIRLEERRPEEMRAEESGEKEGRTEPDKEARADGAAAGAIPAGAERGGGQADFERFFKAYPPSRRGGREEARREWAALAGARALPALGRLLETLDAWRASEAWKAEGGRYVPGAARFLSREYWLRSPPGDGPDRSGKATGASSGGLDRDTGSRRRCLTAAEEKRRRMQRDAQDVLKAREMLRHDPDNPYGDGIGGDVRELPPAQAGRCGAAPAGG